MYKPDSLRTFLTGAIPDLARDPDQLLIYIDGGSVVTSLAPGSSWEYRYALHLVLCDLATDPDIIFAPLTDWLRVHQPDGVANSQLNGDLVKFEADILDNDKVDLAITLQLTERAICSPRAGGGYDITHPPEPQPEASLPLGTGAAHWQLYVKDDLVAEWDSPAG